MGSLGKSGTPESWPARPRTLRTLIGSAPSGVKTATASSIRQRRTSTEPDMGRLDQGGGGRGPARRALPLGPDRLAVAFGPCRRSMDRWVLRPPPVFDAADRRAALGPSAQGLGHFHLIRKAVSFR